eukprot:3305734-Rhodomonas_salina.3
MPSLASSKQSYTCANGERGSEQNPQLSRFPQLLYALRSVCIVRLGNDWVPLAIKPYFSQHDTQEIKRGVKKRVYVDTRAPVKDTHSALGAQKGHRG